VTDDEIAMVERNLARIEAALATERGKWKARVASLEAELRRTTAELTALRGPP